MARPKHPTSKQAAASAPAGPALALHEATARVQTLLGERERLLREVQRKKRQLERTRETVASAAEAFATKMTPIVSRHEALVLELTKLFDELLAPGRLSARARAQVGKLRGGLELQGVLASPSEAPLEAAAPEPDDQPWSEAEARRRAASRASSRREPSMPSSRPELTGAEQVGQGRRSLRELFRSLARAVHPDRAREESERQHRTDVMKEVTRAYEDGDLARLLELEGAWQSEQVVAGGGDSLERCRELERLNRELLDQVRRLTRQIRDLKREAFDEHHGIPVDLLVRQAHAELDELRELCLMISRFRDGKVTLAELSELTI